MFGRAEGRPTMTDHLLACIVGLAAGMAAAVLAAIATRVQVLPDVIDISIIPLGAGLASLGFAFYGALRRFEPDRLGRVTLLGTLLGGGTVVFLVLALLVDVLS
jgi:hypothetical protein